MVVAANLPKDDSRAIHVEPPRGSPARGDRYMKQQKESHAMRRVTVVFGTLFILFGVPLFVGGASLLRLGGSSYYVIAGVGLIASGVQLLRQRASGVGLYALVVSGTLIWSLAESGLSMWGLLPRLGTFIGLGAVFATALAWTRPQLAGGAQRWGRPMVVAVPVAIAFLLLAATAISDLNAESPRHTSPGT